MIDVEVVKMFIGFDAFPLLAAFILIRHWHDDTVSTNTPVLHVGGRVIFWLWIIVLKNPFPAFGIIKATMTIVEDKNE